VAEINPAIEFAENPEPRCPCVLLLDVSGSMSVPTDRPPIAELNHGLRAFEQAIKDDPVARRRVDVAIVAFGSRAELVQDFITADDFAAPYLETSGTTAMAEAVTMGLDVLTGRKAEYKQFGIPYYRPWMFLITDGGPDDTTAFQAAAARATAEEQARGVSCFAVGVAGANMAALDGFGARPPVRLEGLQFADLFLWLSASFSRVSQSSPGEQVALPALTWGAVD
jgi:uncharacterized protein YegL